LTLPFLIWTTVFTKVIVGKMASAAEDGPPSQKKDERTTYQRPLMLALSKSPLVSVPDGMPALAQWYGDWEPYHFRSFPQQGNHAGKGHRSGGVAIVHADNEAGASRNRFRRGERAAHEHTTAELEYAGRNPFGQLSSSGAFRPAGRTDGLANSAPTVSYGRNGVMGKIGREISQRSTRGGALSTANIMAAGDGSFEDDQEGYEARRRAAAASDWRKAPGGAGSAGRSPMANRFAKDGGQKTSFPSWMADEAEPAWMGGGGEKRRAGDGPAFNEHEDINVDDVDVSGMDDIQAFKVRMKEKEKRARQRELGITGEHSSMPSQQAAEKSQAALFDDFASSAKQRAQGKAQDEDEADGDTATEIPLRTSRFARFFDGGNKQASMAETDANSSSAMSMADLFRSMDVGRQEATATAGDRGSHAAPPSVRPPPAGPPPGLSGDGDAHGMQKIMALLTGGGNGGPPANSSQQPPPPPGLHLGRPDFGGSPVNSPSPSSPHHLRRGAEPITSPNMQPSHFAQQQQQPPPPPPPGWHGGQPLYGPPPPGFNPQHHHPPPPVHAGFPPFPPGMRPPPLPPQLQQHLIGLPPQVQHQIISQHFHHMATSGGAPTHMPPPPPGFAAPMPHAPQHSPNLRTMASPPPQHGSDGDGKSHLMTLLGQANAS
jgi:hypothetical protein